MKKWKQILTIAAALVSMAATPIYAAGWQWMDYNHDNVSECYYVQDDGSVLTSTTTPDGYVVNENGAWTENGVVQTRQETVVTQSASSLRQAHMKTSQLESFEYWLYTPENATANMPLIVMLHGHGSNISVLKNDKYFVGFREAAKNNGAYILAPLLPYEYDLGVKGMWPAIEPSIMELVNAMAEKYQIDRNRIYLFGASMGADAGFQIVNTNPNTFACMVGVVPFHYKCPIRKWEDSWAENLKTVPTWLFVEDEKSAKDMAAAATSAIIGAGGQAWTYVQTGEDHGQAGKSVAADYNKEIYDWMLSVSKGK